MAFNLGNNLASLRVRIGADTSPLRKAIKNIGRDLQPMSQQLEKVGRNMTTFVSLPLAAAGAASVKAAIDFETAFAGVRKTIDASESEFAALEKGIIDMSKELPTSANEIAGVAEAAGQLGIETDNVLKFSRVMVDLGETTNLSANQAATSLARFANVTGMAQGDFDRLGSAIVDLGNNFATTEAEITEMALRLAGSGKQVGLSESQILGFAAALSSVGVRAEAGGTAFSKLFAEIQSAVSQGGAQLNRFADVAGMTASSFAEAFREDAAGATTAFIRGLGNVTESGGDALAVLDSLEITEIRMRDALLRVAGAGDLLSRSIDTSNKAWGVNNALMEEAAKRYNTTAARLAKVKNRITAAALVIGEELLPAVEASAEAVGDLADGFSDLDAPMQKAIVGAGALVLVIGPLVSILDKVIKNLGKIKTAVVFLSRFFPLAGLIGAGALTGRDRIDPDDFFQTPKGDSAIEKYFNRILGRFDEVQGKFREFGKPLTRGLAAGEGLLGANALLNSLAQSAEEATAAAKGTQGALEGAGGAATEISDKDFELNFEPPERALQGLYELFDIQQEVAYSFEQQAAERIEWLRRIDAVQRDTFLRGAASTAPSDLPDDPLSNLEPLLQFKNALKDAVINTGIGAIDDFTHSLGGAIAGFEDLGDAVKRIMRQVVASMAAAIAQAIILKGLLTIFPSSGIIGSIAGAFGFTTGFKTAPIGSISGAQSSSFSMPKTVTLRADGADMIAVIDTQRGIQIS